MPLFSESDWTKVGGGGGGISYGPRLLGKVSIDITGGSVNVKRDSEQRTLTLRYGGVGATIGGAIVPSLVNFAMDMPSGASSDRIYKSRRAGTRLDANELRGRFLMISVGIDLMAGYSMAGMYIGGREFNIPSVGILDLAILSGEILYFMGTAKAYIPMSGPTLTVLPGNVGASYVSGVIR